MYRSALGIVALMGLASAVGAQTPRRPMTFDDIMALEQVGTPAIAPDGHAVVFSVSAWEHPRARSDTALGDEHERRSHLWLVPTAGGTPRQITFGDRSEGAPAWSPDGRLLAFIAAREPASGAGAPKPQIWILPLDRGGEAWQLTTAREGVSSFTWSPDGTRIAFLESDTLATVDAAKRKRKDDPRVYESNFRVSHVWVVDVASHHASEVAHGDFTVRGAPSWSPDGTRLAFGASPTPMLRDLRGGVYVVTLKTKRIERIASAPHSPPTALARPVWSPDGATLAFVTVPQGEKIGGDGIMAAELGNGHLMLYDVATRRITDVHDPSFDYLLGPMEWTPDGTRLVFTADDHAYTSVCYYDIAARRFGKIASGLLLRGLSYSTDGQTVAFAMERADAPFDIYVSDAAFHTPRKLTDMNPQVRSFALGETEVIEWRSRDGTPVQGILLKPVGYEPGKRYPLLVEAHGGPTGASDAGFKASYSSPGQVWAGRGWAVLYPNPRGSVGYGERFMRANVMDWGGGDYEDIMAGVDHVIRAGIADSSRMAFDGWSYGGYMTAWVVSQTSRFKAARMGAGISDLRSMYGTTDIPGYIGLFFDGMPTGRTLEYYRAHSAITYVDRVTTPLLILHGAEDQRVPVGQALEFYRALTDRGRTVELVFYPREGHGLREYYHQLDKMRREYEWIARYTLGPAARRTAGRSSP